MDNYSLSDLRAATENNDGWGGNGGAWWLIILFLFAFMGNGWNNKNQNAEPVTEAGLCNAMNFNDLQNADYSRYAR